MTPLILTTDPTLAAGGDAVARAPDGRVVFIEGAAPSETVRVEVVKDNRRFLRARVVEVVSPSADRVEPVCPHYGECGGCSLQHVGPQAQLQSKQDALMTTLEKLGGVTPREVLPPWSGPAYGYRARARLAVGPDGRLGYRAAKGRRVTPVDRCPVLLPVLETALVELNAARAGRRRAARAELSLVTDGVRVASAWTGSAAAATDDETLLADGVRVHPALFSQANPSGNRALRAQVEAWLRGWSPLGTVVELYAGNGNLTAAIAEVAERVVSYEPVAEAVELARRVSPDHVSARVASAEAAAAAAEPTADVVVVDPPRAGLSSEVAAALPRWARRGLIYVSCDPATFARDAGRFEQAGWRLDRVRLFDLYPQTAHAEVAGCFTPSALSGAPLD